MRNLLIITQRVDEGDDLLGFFVDWLREFSKEFDKIFVITLAKGQYVLPPNVYVYSLGKENKNSKLVRVFNLYKYLFKLVPRSNGIFAHMSPVFVIASWPVAFIYRKRIIFWYLHRSVTMRLKIAEKLCYKIVTAFRESLKLNSQKIIETGHGINVEKFKTEREWAAERLNIVSVGRISKIKNYETLLHAAKILKDRNFNFRIKIVGQPVMAPDFEYQKSLLSLREKLGLKDTIEFVGFVPYNQIVRHHREAEVVVGLTPEGGIDKAILEGMAAGCVTFTSNKACSKYFGEYADKLIFEFQNPQNLADKISSFAVLSPQNKKDLSDFLVSSVARDHELNNLISKISLLYV